MDPIKVDFNKKDTARKKEIVIPPEKAGLKKIISLIGTVIVAFVAFYFMMPAVNPKSYDLYIYLGIVAASYVIFNGLLCRIMDRPEYMPYVKRRAVVPGIVIAALLVVVGIGYLVSCVVFRADAYSKIISVRTDKSFSEDITEETAESFSKIPKLDEAAAAQLATRALGDLADEGLVSQFTVYPMYTQINYKEKPVRVVPLKYANIIKWLTNRSEGLPGYVKIDMANEKTDFVLVKGGIKYSPAEHFGRLLKRQLRFNYPTYLFAEPTFEIDDEGNPYWICARLDKTIGLFGGTDVIGAVILRADDSTGSSKYYAIEELKNDASLQWIDRIYDSDLLVEQYDYYGKYQNGFWNSILGQKDVINTTSGYNYIAKDDDVWMYTGITSVTSDQSITGFALINQRTKEAIYYRVSGGTEISAEEAAEGRVKDLGYDATFPLLLNIGGEPTYFMSLKDASNIVQQYAMINVENYNKIGATGSNLAQCLESYITMLKSVKDVTVDINPEDVVSTGTDATEPEVVKVDVSEVSGIVTDIRSAVISGQSIYYIAVEGSEAYYSVSAADYPDVVILNKGDNVVLTVSSEASGKIVEAESFEIK